MKKINNPPQKEWATLCERPVFKAEDLGQIVTGIMDRVKKEGDAALNQLTRQFDCAQATSITVSTAIDEAELDPALVKAIRRAKANIEAFHRQQWEPVQEVETSPGVVCWRQSVPIERVGLYIPGGTAPLFSTMLMLAVPARIAGCRELVVCTPLNAAGNIHPAIRFTAQLLGIETLYGLGGAQAVAAMTFGTKTVPQVDKIFGPGNQFVTQAKVEAQKYGVAIDLPAGPSEVLVIADKTAQPVFVAADLLSQAEHGLDSQVVLVCTDEAVLDRTLVEIKRQTASLKRGDMIRASLSNSTAILLPDLSSAVAYSNAYAPEHLIIAIDEPRQVISDITNAGSVFLGHYTPESAGDYASGTNHTLPTNGYARNYSGVSLDSFVKKITFQEISQAGIQDLGPDIEIMAANEDLDAHKNAVTVRLQSLQA